LQYLLTGDPDAWNHLIGIMLQAKGNLFLAEPGLPLLTATRRFLELWLLEKLAPYREADPDTICAAAERGDFRYFGKQAKNALIDEIRKRNASQDALDQHLSEKEWWAGRPPRVVSLDAPLDDDVDFTLGNHLATDSSQDHLPSTLGKQPRLEPEMLQQVIRDREREFKRLLGPLHDVLVTVCALYIAFPDDLRKGDAAMAVAAARGVSVQTARRKLRQLVAIFRRALQAGNPTVRELHTMLRTSRRPTFLVYDRRSGRPRMA
jgi:hypothetical protein